MERIEQHASFGGRQEVWRHASRSTGCDMRLGVYLPPAALRGEACPVLYWLSGLTCTEQNVITKAGMQAHAAQHGLIVVAPDTSPRDPAGSLNVPNDAAYDLGQGAGFYLDAMQAPWAMYCVVGCAASPRMVARPNTQVPMGSLSAVAQRRQLLGSSISWRALGQMPWK